MDDKARVASIFENNKHLILSTASQKGKPWITPLAYTFDGENSLYWVSSKESQHSLNIRDREEVAIVIYMVEPASDAVYVDAKAHELTDNQAVLDALDIIQTRPQPDKFRVSSSADVTGDAAWRIYKAIPEALYLREQSVINDQTVTVRRKI